VGNYTVIQIYDQYERDILSAGEALDYYLQNQLNEADPELCKYILDKDGDELTDDEAIELAYLRLKQLRYTL